MPDNAGPLEVMQRQYVDQMEAIKRRTAAIKKLSEIAATGQISPEIATESIYLQFRKILELIAMSSLVANKQAMKKVNQSMMKKLWRGSEILKRIERINPDFYPVPLIEKPHPDPIVKTDLVDKTDGFLSRAEFRRLYNLCGSFMHADNPLGRKKTDYEALWKKGPEWQNKIMELLGCHKIRLVDQDGFYLVHMNEERDGRVHMYQFAKLHSDPQGSKT